MIPRIPLSIRYFYSEIHNHYKEVGTHRTITVAEYEALEKREARANIIGLKIVLCMLISFAFIAILTWITA